MVAAAPEPELEDVLFEVEPETEPERKSERQLRRSRGSQVPQPEARSRDPSNKVYFIAS